MAATIIHVIIKNFKQGKEKSSYLNGENGGLLPTGYPYLNVQITHHTVFKIGNWCFADQIFEKKIPAVEHRHFFA